MIISIIYFIRAIIWSKTHDRYDVQYEEILFSNNYDIFIKLLPLKLNNIITNCR